MVLLARSFIPRLGQELGVGGCTCYTRLASTLRQLNQKKKKMDGEEFHQIHLWSQFTLLGLFQAAPRSNAYSHRLILKGLQR